MIDFLKRFLGVDEKAASEPQRKFSLEALVALQREYWTRAPKEKAALLARLDALEPRETLRLHHLNCLDLLAASRYASPDDELEAPPAGEELELCKKLLGRLADAKSPYRPRLAHVWQVRRDATPEANRAPDHHGALTNASLSHLGALEIIRLEGTTPTELDFFALDAIRAVHIGPPGLFRPARVYLEGETDSERFVPALIPLLYGPSWESVYEFDKDGTMTRFVFHVDGVLGGRGLAMGIGHQDFTFANGGLLFGMGSIERIAFPLDMREPDFDTRCRGRGMDPEELRRRVATAQDDG